MRESRVVMVIVLYNKPEDSLDEVRLLQAAEGSLLKKTHPFNFYITAEKGSGGIWRDE